MVLSNKDFLAGPILGDQGPGNHWYVPDPGLLRGPQWGQGQAPGGGHGPTPPAGYGP